MPGDVTTLRLTSPDVTVLTVSSNDVTVVREANTASNNSEVTVLNASAATLTVPASIQFSSDVPLGLTEFGSAGVALTASRSDHRHPTDGMLLNGGNF